MESPGGKTRGKREERAKKRCHLVCRLGHFARKKKKKTLKKETKMLGGFLWVGGGCVFFGFGGGGGGWVLVGVGVGGGGCWGLFWGGGGGGVGGVFFVWWEDPKK